MSATGRRRFLTASGAVLAASALAAYGQSRVPRIGLLTYAPGKFTDRYVHAFREGLTELGYEDGRNIVIDWRSGQLSRERTERLADELIASRPAVIVAQGVAIRVSMARTKTIPIVCANSGDMVEAGFVKSLAQPGGNVTGVQLLALDLAGKRMELLRELLPGARRIAVIADPAHGGEHRERDVSIKAAERLGMQVSYHPARSYQEFDAALAAAHAAGAEALVFFPDAISNTRTEQGAAFALQHKVATVAGWSNYVEAGQLISYGPHLEASWRRLAYYVDRILKGAQPETLPVEQPTVFELAVNLKTARALGINVPQSILLRADRVIE
jgi:putative ABC transport system substrate-binding protein